MGNRSSISIRKHKPSIFQGKIAFAAAPSISLSVEHPFEQHLFRVFGGTLALLACLYLYFVSASVLNVIARKEASAQSARLATEVSGLERQYYVASGEVKPEDGASMGLAPVSETAYVYRAGASASARVAASNNEI